VNLADLKTRIFRMTNHIYNDTFHMTDLVNDALNIIATEAKLEAETSINVTAGTANYPLPTDYKSPRALMEGTLDCPIHIYDLVPPEEISYGYSIWNGEIIIKPTPTQNVTLNFYYYKFPSELKNDEDIPDIDPQYHEILAAYAAAMILSLPGVEGVSNALRDRYFAMWDEGRSRFQADMERKNRQRSVRKVGQIR